MANWVTKTTKKVTDFAKRHPNVTTLGTTWAANQMGLGGLEAINQGVKLGMMANNNRKSNKMSTDAPIVDYDYNDVYDTLLAGGSGGYSSGGGAYKPDVSALLDSYNQQNEAAKQTAKTNYDITKNNLIESLKRYQESNMKQQQQQQQDLLNTQSELENTGAAQSREARINAGARGLSGSGIQQLNQLQRLASQGNKVTDVASKNTAALTKLNDALISKQEKTDEAIADALSTYINAINKADTGYGDRAADAIMNAEKAYASSLASSSGSGGDDSDYDLVANDIYNVLNGTTQQLKTNLNYIGGLSNKDLKDYATQNGISLKGVSAQNRKSYIEDYLRSNALQELEELNQTYPVSNINYNRAITNIYDLVNSMQRR